MLNIARIGSQAGQAKERSTPVDEDKAHAADLGDGRYASALSNGFRVYIGTRSQPPLPARREV